MKLISTILILNFISLNVYSQADVATSALNGGSAALTAGAADAVAGEKAEGMCSGGNMVACAAVPMIAMQVISMLRTSSGARSAADASECTGAFCGNTTDNTPTETPVGVTPTPNGIETPSPTINRLIRNAQDTLNRYKEKGFEFNRDGSVTTPDGKNITGAALASGGSGTGFSDKDLSEFEKIKNLSQADKNKINKLLNQIAGELEGGGGPKGKAGRGYDSKGGIDYAKLFAGLNSRGSAGARGLAGLEKKLGTDNIGVAQDNIFLMISRRYTVKKPHLNP